MSEPAASPKPKVPRGIRLHNPGNIRHGPDVWKGAADDQPDSDFVKFKDATWGIRAIARLLMNYKQKGVDTVREIIDRWAPPIENDTESYIKSVAKRVGVDPNEQINVDDYAVMLPLVKAIIQHENGRQPYSDAQLARGIAMAGVKNAPQEAFSKKIAGKCLAGGSVALGLISQAAEPAQSTANTLASFTGSPIIQHIATGALTLAGLAALAGLGKAWIEHKRGH